MTRCATAWKVLVASVVLGTAATACAPTPPPAPPPPCVQGSVLPGPGGTVLYSASRLSGPIADGALFRTWVSVGVPSDCSGPPTSTSLVLGDFPFADQAQYLANLDRAQVDCTARATAAGALSDPSRQARVIGQVSGLPPGVILCVVLGSGGEVVWPVG